MGDVWRAIEEKGQVDADAVIVGRRQLMPWRIDAIPVMAAGLVDLVVWQVAEIMQDFVCGDGVIGCDDGAWGFGAESSELGIGASPAAAEERITAHGA